MLKKTLVVGLGCFLVLALLFGRSGWSYITTSVSEIRESVKGSVPIEFELKRAKKQIRDLQPEIRDAMHEIAKAEVDVEKLAREVQKSEGQLSVAKSNIMRLKTHLDSGDKYFVSHGEKYDNHKVEQDLSRRFERFKVKEATTKKLQTLLTARQKSLTAARDKLDTMQAEVQQLEAEVANLEAEHQVIEVAKASSEFNFDDSDWSHARRTLDEIRTRLEVEKKLANADVHYADEIPLDESMSSGDISEEIDAYFNPADEDYVSSAR